MPARAGNTSTKRRRGRGRPVSPTGPYRAESSKRSIRKKASPAEVRKLSRGSSRTSKRVRRLAKKDRREAEKTTKQVKKATASRPIETLRRAEAKLAKRSDPKLREATRRLRHALAAEAVAKARQPTPEGTPENFPERELKSVAPRAYRKARYAAEAPGSSGGLGEPGDLTFAITSAIPGAGFAGALGKRAFEVGGKTVAKEVGKTTAVKAGSVAVRAAQTPARARAVGGAVRRGTQRATGRKAKADVGRKAAIRRREARAARRAELRAKAVVLPGAKLGKVGAIQAPPVTRGHEQAVTREPKKTAKQTAIAAAGMAIALPKLLASPAVSGGRAVSAAAHEAGVPGFRPYSGKEILAPLGEEGKAQLAFARQVAKVITSDDPDYVQKQVSEELGLLLPALLALGSYAGGRRVSKGRITKEVRKLANRARSRPRPEFRGEPPRVFEKQGQRKGAARTVAQKRARAVRERRGATGRYIHEATGAKGGEVIRTAAKEPQGALKRAVAKPGISHREAKGALVARPGDIIPFATRHSIDLSNPARALEQIKAVGRSLEPLPEGVRLPKGKMHTRELIEYVERNPGVLTEAKVRRGLGERRKAGAYKREQSKREPNRALEPEHSERGRYVPVAVSKRRPLPEHMYPKDVRDIVRAEPKYGVLAKEVLRKEAREDKAAAKRLRRKAGTAKHKANVLRGELAVREKLNKDRLGLPNQGLRPTKSQLREIRVEQALARRGKGRAARRADLRPAGELPKSHEHLRERIDKLDMEAVALREQAQTAEAMAKRKQKASQGFDPALEREFVQREAAELTAEGRPQPEFVGTGYARLTPAYGATGVRMSGFQGASKVRKGTAEQYGMVEEGLVADLRESFQRPIMRRESYASLRKHIDDNEFRTGGKNEWTSNEARELFSERVLSEKDWVWVPNQLYNRAYGKFDPEAAAAELKLTIEGKALGRDAPRTKGKLLRREATEEFFNQFTGAYLHPKLVAINRATNYLILATSPAWAVAQVAAEYAQAALSEPRLLNPMWVKKAIREYEAMAPHKRQAFDSWVGVTRRELTRREEAGLATVESAGDAYTAFRRTPLGRLVFSIRDFDRWKGGKIRTLVAITKIDREMNGRLNSFARGVGQLDKMMESELKAMRGKPLREQLDWIAEHPKLAERHANYLNDVMGDWLALTKNERVASQLLIFYPFLRMSLRWTFYAFPKHHPIRTATLAYLSQQNATETKRLLGGDPAFFSEHMKVPVKLGGGEVIYVPLARVVPGAAAPLEALGGGIEGPKGTVALRTAQPVIGAAVTLATGVDPLTGKQEKGSFWNAAEQLFPTNLSAPGRALKEILLPSGRKPGKGVGQILPGVGSERQKSIDKLTAKLYGYGTSERYLRNLAAPLLPEKGQRVADRALLNRIFRAFEQNGSSARDDLSAAYAERMRDAVEEGKRRRLPKLRKVRDKRLAAMSAEDDEANRRLDKLFERYRIPHKKEDRLFLEFYGEGKFGQRESAAEKLNKKLGIPPASSKTDLDRQLGIPSAPTREELDKRLGISR